MTELQVQKELEKAEASQQKTGGSMLLHKTGPLEFVSLGLKLEETQ